MRETNVPDGVIDIDGIGGFGASESSVRSVLPVMTLKMALNGITYFSETFVSILIISFFILTFRLDTSKKFPSSHK
jgi:hypothetical protein